MAPFASLINFVKRYDARIREERILFKNCVTARYTCHWARHPTICLLISTNFHFVNYNLNLYNDRLLKRSWEIPTTKVILHASWMKSWAIISPGHRLIFLADLHTDFVQNLPHLAKDKSNRQKHWGKTLNLRWFNDRRTRKQIWRVVLCT